LNGKNLALMKISKSLRMTFFIFLITSLFFGVYGFLPFFIISLFILFTFVFIQTITSSYRFEQIRNFLIIILFLSIVELIRINFIKW
jgi:formate hydrogenlyase subunit 4